MVSSKLQAYIVLNHAFADGQALGILLKAWPEASTALFKISRKIPSPMFCCYNSLTRSLDSVLSSAQGGDLPVPFLAVMFARTEQERGGESLQRWQEAMSPKPHSQGCFTLRPKLRRKLHPPSGQDWSHGPGLPLRGTSPGTQRCFWEEKGKGTRLQAISG